MKTEPNDYENNKPALQKGLNRNVQNNAYGNKSNSNFYEGDDRNSNSSRETPRNNLVS